MNLPVLGRFLAEISLQEVDLGSAILDIINQVVEKKKGGEPFSIEMTGFELYEHYKQLTPSARIELDRRELMDIDEWIALVKQCDYLQNSHLVKAQHELWYRHLAYFGVVTICIIFAIFTGLSYIANLVYHSDKVDSVLVNFVYQLIVTYPNGS